LYFFEREKEFMGNLKNIYNVLTKEGVCLDLDRFEQIWGAKYPYAIHSWRTNWDELMKNYKLYNL
jgi:transposase-like protein